MNAAELLATWEGKQPSPDMVAAHDKVLAEFGLTRAQARDVSVLAKFDILLHLQEATQGVPVPPVVPPKSDQPDAGDYPFPAGAGTGREG